jgi:hypothetical protein
MTDNKKNDEMALEMRLRRMWKQDIDAHYRSIIQDILSHVETTAQAAVKRPLEQQSDSVKKILETSFHQHQPETQRTQPEDRRSSGAPRRPNCCHRGQSSRDEYKHELRKEYFEQDGD